MVGKKPVLIVDLDPNHESGPGIIEALDELEIYNYYTRAFPGSVENYQSLFISLGTQLAYYELTIDEGAFLADYLIDGGKIYLEGRRIWRTDQVTPLQPMFNIDTENTPALYYVVEGIDSTFTEGMSFQNLANSPISFYSLVPIAPAFDILRSQEDSISCAVAYDAGDYKTIGAVIEFGQLMDDTSRKADLMEQILFFFDIKLSTIGIEEPEENRNVSSVYSFPNPFRNEATISFSLEQESKISLNIYNMNGQLIENLLPERKYTKGIHYFKWNPGAEGLHGGIYLYRLVSDKQVVTGKMILLN